MEDKRFDTEESVIQAPPALSLDIKDDDLVKYIDVYNDAAKKFYKGKKIDERRDTNERFYFGRQLEDRTYKGVTYERSLKKYEKPYLDNIIKEGEDTLRPIVLSRLPDFILTGGASIKSSKTSEALAKVVNDTLQSRELKKVLTKSFKHHPVYFVGVIKYRWDQHKGRLGDVVFEAVHPRNVLLPHIATENNERSMPVITHYVEKSLKDWIMMFPDKEDELITYAKEKGKVDEINETSLAANIKVEEVWFDWYERKESEDEGEEDQEEKTEYEFRNGVCWKLGKSILKKSLNPNWDWEGTEELFFNGQPVGEEQLEQMTALGLEIPGIESKKVYRNFFGKPRKPFIFI